jgi:hypothetical protein
MTVELSADKANSTFKSKVVYTSEKIAVPNNKNEDQGEGEDIFISKPSNPTLVKAKSTGIFAMFSMAVKNFVWVFISPVVKLLSFIEQCRCSWALEKVKNRNNAKTNEEIEKYHNSVLFDENNPDEKKIFKYFLSDKKGEKPLIVLFMGNAQTHLWSDSDAGMIKLYEKLKKDNEADVLLFRVGNAIDDVKHKLFLSNDCSLSTDIVYQHSVNVLEDAISGKGIFAGHSKPSKVSFVGYSWGGGTVDKLLKEDWKRIGQNIPVAATVQIDAVNLGLYNLSTPVLNRPFHSRSHLNIFQNKYDFLNGCNQSINVAVDQSMVIADESSIHNGVDDNLEVLSTTYSFVKERVIGNK